MFWMNHVQIMRSRRKVTSGRKDAGTISSLVKARGLRLECARVLCKELLMLVLLYVNETKIWR